MPDDGRLPLGATGWWIWEHFVLRSTGFPLGELTEALVPAPAAATEGAEAGEKAAMRRAVELAGRERFRMALLWQNPAIIENVLTPLERELAAPDPEAAAGARKKDRQRRRRRERTLARYLQRYYTRNESIGFFGPVAWGRFAGLGRPLAMHAGQTLTDRQLVWFEDWSIHHLGREIARDPDVRRQLAPVLGLGVERLGRTVLRGRQEPYRLAPEEAAVLDLVDGRRTAAEIGAALDTPGGGRVFAQLEAMAANGILAWDFAIPPDPDSDRFLAEQLRALPESAPVKAALEGLEALEQAKAAAGAATDAAGLAAAIANVEHCFESLVPEAARRTADQEERGRCVLLAQSQRAVDLTVDEGMLAELAEPLDLVLRAARWYCRRVGDHMADALHRDYLMLAAKYGADKVSLDALFTATLTGVSEPWFRAKHVDAVSAEVVERWMGVLDLDPSARHVRFTVQELTDRVAEAFGGPSPSWYSGRHHSPDVMIAADGVDAVARGDYMFILGEVHAGGITCDKSTNNGFDPAPGAILRPSEAALGDGTPRYVPLYVRTMPGVTARGYPVPESFSEKYTYLSLGGGEPERRAPEGRRLEMSAILVSEGPDGLVARFPDGTVEPILTVVGEFLAFLTKPNFGLSPQWPHIPRVTIGRMTVTRETWRVPASALTPHARGVSDPLEAVRAVMRELGVPRHCFWREGPGIKPLYLDAESPVLVRLLADAVRTADAEDSFCFTEMLPGPDDLWLEDGQGARYTSELRITVAEQADGFAAAVPAAPAAGGRDV